MLNLETALLNALLDRYERSRGFKENRSQQRRIQLQMYGGSKTDFSAYDIEDSSARTAINEAAKKLAVQGVIELEWLRGQEGHILRRIALCPGALVDAYHRTGREQLADTAGQLEKRLRQVQQASSAPWVCRYLQEELDFLAKNRRRGLPSRRMQRSRTIGWQYWKCWEHRRPNSRFWNGCFLCAAWEIARHLKSTTAPGCWVCCASTFRWIPRR